MLKLTQADGIYRIIDANINRVKEGLRVCEEITRFILNNRRLTSQLKKTRHAIDAAINCLPRKSALLKQRSALEDVGKNISARELIRGCIEDVYRANIQRVKESLRVLEEFSKLLDCRCALKFKAIRYAAYDLEKSISVILQKKKRAITNKNNVSKASEANVLAPRNDTARRCRPQ
ncbi:MAG: thiamine-phosphate pyrophosphorylase [Candidatus Omnitrophota bacterium]